MGSSLSHKRDRADRLVIDALRGRRMDLPGGGELYIMANAGYNKCLFTTRDGMIDIRLYAIGRARVRDGGRELLIFRGRDGTIYGREAEVGLHVLAVNMRDLLCNVGISHRDIRVLEGTYEDRRKGSPTRGKARVRDVAPGRAGDASLQRRCSDYMKRQEGAGEQCSGEYQYYEERNCSSANAATVNAVKPVQLKMGRGRVYSESAARVRFGSTTIMQSKDGIGGDMEKVRHILRLMGAKPSTKLPDAPKGILTRGTSTGATTSRFNERAVDVPAGDGTDDRGAKRHRDPCVPKHPQTPLRTQGHDSDYSSDENENFESDGEEVMF
ncbi:myristylated tegument protein CIRC [Columbid alphaherpesvirus 1]|uniref:Myristylated tegument protein CIRC n=1 Tax=Columbid alphaherpesvirus 1 TaxID=93386 RepID=A0A1V0M8J5_9ALPH|nr:myristylated tegument protein CIRC [Columbid alphaherpesvirus 1]ARD71386.1 myristylated tegument protein CIRC [Columbid alphaherpesvirus 1]